MSALFSLGSRRKVDIDDSVVIIRAKVRRQVAGTIERASIASRVVWNVVAVKAYWRQ